MMKSHGVIAVRDFANTKLRLGTKLTGSQRFLLTSTFLDIVLKALQHSLVTDVTVVATNPSEVAPKQKRFSKLRTIKEQKRRGGVNLAMEDGIKSLRAERRERTKSSVLLLLPSDLPFLNSETLDKVLFLKESYDLIINPSRKKDGTSLLLLEESKLIPLHYDDNSFVRHMDEAKKMNLNYHVTDLKPLSIDVDDDEDLSMLNAELCANSFDQLIDKLQAI